MALRKPVGASSGMGTLRDAGFGLEGIVLIASGEGNGEGNGEEVMTRSCVMALVE